MKREKRVQEIIKIAKNKRLNITTMTFLLAMTPDKGLVRIYNSIRDYADGEIIEFSKSIQLPDEYEEKIFTIPNSEYRLTHNKKRQHKGRIILNGIWNTNSSTFGAAFSFSPEQFKELKQHLK